jgi:coenzyme F420-reducing hydrogenase delta subunit
MLGTTVDLSSVDWMRDRVREQAIREAVLAFRDTAMHLRDMEEGIDRISEFVSGLSFEDYRNDRKTRSAVERQMQIITEAADRLGDEA